MSGFLRRALGAFGNGLKPSFRESLRARAHFRAPLPAGPLIAQRYVVFNLESTGLDVSGGDRLLSIGAVRLRGGEARESFTTLVNPACNIPPGSIRYHGITDAMVADSPPAAAALAQFQEFNGDDVLVAHNAAFDRALIFLLGSFAARPPSAIPSCEVLRRHAGSIRRRRIIPSMGFVARRALRLPGGIKCWVMRRRQRRFGSA